MGKGIHLCPNNIGSFTDASSKQFGELEKWCADLLNLHVTEMVTNSRRLYLPTSCINKEKIDHALEESAADSELVLFS